MVSLTSFAGRKAYNVKEYTIDSVDDLSNLPITAEPGSTAFVIKSSETYMLDGNKQWVKIATSSGGSDEDIHVATGYLNDDLDLILTFNTSEEPITVNMGTLTSLTQNAIDQVETLTEEVNNNKGTEITADYVEDSFSN